MKEILLFQIFIQTNKTLFEDLQHLKEDSNFSDSDSSFQICSENNKRVVGNMKLKTSPELDSNAAVFSDENILIYSLKTKQFALQAQRSARS